MSVNNTSFTIKNNLASSIRNYLKQQGKTNVTEKEMNTILQRMAQIDADRDSGKTQGGSIFSGGHKYLGGSGRDFVVQQGQQITLSQEEYNKVFEGFLDQMGTQKLQIPSKSPAQPTIQQPKFDEGKALQKLKQEMDKVEVEPLEIKETITSKDKTWNREVDGKKQMICERKENGKTVTYAVNQDGTLGEKLITKSTLGKNTYATQSQMNKDMRTMLGLGADDPMPTDIEGTYVEYRGEGFLVFKKDGKVMDNAQLREYTKKLHAQTPAPAGGPSPTPTQTPAQTTTPTGGSSPAPSSVSTAKSVSTHAPKLSSSMKTSFNETIDNRLLNLPSENLQPILDSFKKNDGCYYEGDLVEAQVGDYDEGGDLSSNGFYIAFSKHLSFHGDRKNHFYQYDKNGHLKYVGVQKELGEHVFTLTKRKYDLNTGKILSQISNLGRIASSYHNRETIVMSELMQNISDMDSMCRSQEFRDNNGSLILKVADGKYYDKNNSEISKQNFEQQLSEFLKRNSAKATSEDDPQLGTFVQYPR